MILQVRTPSFGGDFREARWICSWECLKVWQSTHSRAFDTIWHYASDFALDPRCFFRSPRVQGGLFQQVFVWGGWPQLKSRALSSHVQTTKFHKVVGTRIHSSQSIKIGCDRASSGTMQAPHRTQRLEPALNYSSPTVTLHLPACHGKPRAQENPRDLHRIPQRTSDVVPLQHLQLSNAFHDGIMIHMLVHQPRRNSIWTKLDRGTAWETVFVHIFISQSAPGHW